MLILILIDVQHSQNAVFSFEKFSDRQNHFPPNLRFSPPGKKIRPAVFTIYWRKVRETPKILGEKEQWLYIDT